VSAFNQWRGGSVPVKNPGSVASVNAFVDGYNLLWARQEG
jgi:hypothetical protein